ncbi:hypothetical protein YPPY53_4490, partial [Yersinia pestis PY-53]
MKPGL